MWKYKLTFEYANGIGTEASVPVLFFWQRHTMLEKGERGMRYQQKATGRAMSMQGGLALGAGISTLVTLLLAIILAKLIDSEKLPWENVGYGIMITLIGASFLGAYCASKRIKRLHMLVCLTSGGIYFAVLLSMTALFFGGQYEAVGITALLVLAGCISAGLLSLGRTKSGYGKKR